MMVLFVCIVTHGDVYVLVYRMYECFVMHLLYV